MGRVRSILDNGGEGIVIDIECHLSNSLPNIVIVGFASKSVDEAKERIRGALANSKIRLPKKRITINLAPADIPKEGSSFDLPILVAILQNANLIKARVNENAIVLGEVGLDGTIRPIRGMIGKILSAKKHGYSEFWIPTGNLSQASLVPGITLHPVNTVTELYQMLNEITPIPVVVSSDLPLAPRSARVYDLTIDDVIGQKQAKRALLIAASGHHHVMLNGPPGTGKSMLAKALPSIMPPLTQDEKLEVTHLHSLARKDFDKIVHDRPIRTPHHSSSHIAIVGGGQSPRPGEITLSHNGILFFDEFPEFGRSIVEALRQPIEDRKITVSRAKDTLEFPAHFLLIATSNPCPCGYYGSKQECSCLPAQINKYQRKISGPIMDRIDLYVDVEEVEHDKLLTTPKRELWSEQASQVARVRKLQLDRSGKLNSELTNRELKAKAKLTPSALGLLNSASAKMNLSARGYIRALRVARTIADLDDSEMVDTLHVSEALQYRKRLATL